MGSPFPAVCDQSVLWGTPWPGGMLWLGWAHSSCCPRNCSRTQLCSWLCCPWMWLHQGNAWAQLQDKTAVLSLPAGHRAWEMVGDGQECSSPGWLLRLFSGNAKAVLTKISQSSPVHEPFPNPAQLIGCFWGRSLNSCCLKAVIHGASQC